MNKNVAISISAVAVIAIIAFVKNENDLTREAIRDATDVKIAETTKDTLDTVGDWAKNTSHEILDKLRETLESHPEPSKRSDEHVEAKPTTPESNSDDKSNTIFGDVFELAVETAQNATEIIDDQLQDAIKLSKEEEKEIGEQLHRQLIESGIDIISNPKVDSLIDELAKPFLSGQNSSEYTFTVINDLQVNAFAMVGGFIYINRGLLEFADNDGELQFVIGHEIGHLQLGHCSKSVTYWIRANEIGGDLAGNMAQMAYSLISLGYSEGLELAADRFGYENMTLNQKHAFTFISRMQELESQQDSSDSSGIIYAAIDGHFASHPTAEERLRNLEELGASD